MRFLESWPTQILCIAVLLACVADIVYLATGSDRALAEGSDGRQRQTSTDSAIPADKQAIMQKLQRSDPFALGTSEQAQAQTSISDDTETVSSVDGLKLAGTIAGSSRQSLAVFTHANEQNPIVARPNQTVHGSWQLHTVLARSAVLDNGGRQVQLALDDDRDVVDGSGNATANQMQTSNQTDQSAGDNEEKLVRRVGPFRWTIPRDIVSERMSDYSSIHRDVGVLPRNKGGFVVNRVRPGSLIDQMGLQRGDVLLKANGQDISEPMELFSLVRSIGQIRHVKLQIERRDEPITLSYELR